MRTITNVELIEAAVKAYEEKRLTAFYPTFGCVYRAVTQDGEKLGCAIGVALTDEEIDKVKAAEINGAAVYNLEPYAVAAFEDEGFASKLQRAHDEWLGCQGTRDHNRFRTLIGLEPLATE